MSSRRTPGPIPRDLSWGTAANSRRQTASCGYGSRLALRLAGTTESLSHVPHIPCQFLRPQIRQFAFQAFDIEPQRAALRKQQYGAAAGCVGLMKLNANQVD